MDAYRFTIYSIVTNSPAAVLDLFIFDYTRNRKGHITGCRVTPSSGTTFDASWDIGERGETETGVCVELITTYLLDSKCVLAQLAPFE